MSSLKLEVLNVVDEGIGRGVFATEEIEKGEQIEECETLVFDEDQLEIINKSLLVEYIFYGEKTSRAFLALGYGSLYNHSREANAEFSLSEDEGKLRFRALRKINKGEEIRVDYTDGRSQQKLWFE